MNTFPHNNLEAITGALGDTNDGLTGSEITNLLQMCDIEDTDPTMTKRVRLLRAFVANQRKTHNHQEIFNFITQAMAPSRYLKKPQRYEIMRKNLNDALSFEGFEVTEEGKIIPIQQTRTLREATEKRALTLCENLKARGIHNDVLKCCIVELMAEDYFHAALEVTKSVVEKLRNLTKLKSDGVNLASAALSGKKPLIAINDLQTTSEKSEQKGFLNLIEGILRMFRNPTAHELTLHWEVNKADIEDLLSIASLIHRRLDIIKERPST